MLRAAYLIVAAALLLFAGQTLSRRYTPIEPLTLSPTPAFDATADARFLEEIGPIDDINHGLTLVRLGTAVIQGVPTPSANYASLMVLNHTSESVRFADVGFGIQAFAYEATTRHWIRSPLLHYPAPMETTLPPKLETLGSTVLNTVEVLPEDLPRPVPSLMRFLVSGTGIQTGTKYAAFVDVTMPDAEGTAQPLKAGWDVRASAFGAARAHAVTSPAPQVGQRVEVAPALSAALLLPAL